MKRTALLLTVMFLTGCGGSNSTPSMQSTANKASSASQPSAGKASDESAALDAIAKINDAESNYFRRNRRYALTFDELVDAHLLDSAPESAQIGYDFSLRPSADAQTYNLSVNPTAPTASVRHFFTDNSGAVRAEAGRDATPDSPKI